MATRMQKATDELNEALNEDVNVNNSSISWASVLLFPLTLMYKLLFRLPHKKNMLLGVFRVFAWGFIMFKTFDVVDIDDIFSFFNKFHMNFVAIIVIVSIIAICLFHMFAGLIYSIGAFEGMIVPGMREGTNLGKTLGYRDSLISNKSYEGGADEVADTGFLGTSGGGGGRNMKKTLGYIDGQLSNRSYSGGLGYLKSLFNS